MRHRHPFFVFALSVVTLGIYSWYWLVSTKNEMNKLGASIPTAWIWLIPYLGGIWWLWKYSKGVEQVTHKQLSGILVFVLFFLLGSIGHAIVQDAFNTVQDTSGVHPESPAKPADTIPAAPAAPAPAVAPSAPEVSK